jgi:hypothetical protein
VSDQILRVYRLGKLPPETVMQALSLMRLHDASGAEWSLGATTRRWYRKLPGGAWRVTVPPSTADQVVQAGVHDALDGVQDLLGVTPAEQDDTEHHDMGQDSLDEPEPGTTAAPQDPGSGRGDPNSTGSAAIDASTGPLPPAAAAQRGEQDETSKLLATFLQQTGQSGAAPATTAYGD